MTVSNHKNNHALYKIHLWRLQFYLQKQFCDRLDLSSFTHKSQNLTLIFRIKDGCKNKD